MQGKDTTISTFFQLFRPILRNEILEHLKSIGVDRYVKKLTIIKLFMLLAFAQLEQLSGLRDISNSLHHKAHSQMIDLSSISHSQIARRLSAIPTEALQTLFQELVRQAGTKIGFAKIRDSVGRIYLIDASVISLCLSRYRWAEFRKTKSGVKLHLRLRLFEQGVFPDWAKITPAKPSDKTQMDNLVVEDGDAINIFDRGYVDYGKFDEYCKSGTRFISRLKINAVANVQKVLPVAPGSAISRDCMAILGKHAKTMEHPLRLIETTDTEGKAVTIVTNVFDMSAEEIGELYRCRWQIEIFFKWLKQNLHVKHIYGLSRQAVETQLYIALITYCLLMILQLDTGFKGPLLTVKRLLRVCLYEPVDVFLKKLTSKSKRSSKGRRRLNHEEVFRQTLNQVEAGEADLLYELTYDPVIL
ncbi:MAG: IS4 family transposase [Firmicutes bacterium]|nr:IS4 family transposase [Bacillota bacterium]